MVEAQIGAVGDDGFVVGGVEGPPEWPMTTRPRSTPSSARIRCCSKPHGWGGVGVWVVIGTPVWRWAWATARSTRSTPGVIPGVSVAHLRMPARTPVSPMPSRISLTNNSIIGSAPPRMVPGPWKWKYIGTSL